MNPEAALSLVGVYMEVITQEITETINNNLWRAASIN